MTVGPDYQVSCWIQPQNNWDNETNKPKPITTEQYNQINEIVDLMEKNNFQMSVTIRDPIAPDELESLSMDDIFDFESEMPTPDASPDDK